MAEAPKQLWVRLAVGGGTISYERDPRESGVDNSRPTYRYRLEEDTEVWLSSVSLLCVECQQPIKARISTQQWIRVEWIGPSGECQACYNNKKTKRVSSEAQLVKDEF